MKSSDLYRTVIVRLKPMKKVMATVAPATYPVDRLRQFSQN